MGGIVTSQRGQPGPAGGSSNLGQVLGSPLSGAHQEASRHQQVDSGVLPCLLDALSPDLIIIWAKSEGDRELPLSCRRVMLTLPPKKGSLQPDKLTPSLTPPHRLQGHRQSHLAVAELQPGRCDPPQVDVHSSMAHHFQQFVPAPGPP